MRPIEEPTVRMEPGPGRIDEAVTSHPAFAQIGAYRVSGRTNLYDSDFTHSAYMTIRISTSRLHRNLNRDWHNGGRKEIIEVALSEAQWATFVSAPNVGNGVPCTLQTLNGELVPGLPDPKSRADQFSDEMRRTLDEALAALDSLGEAIDAAGLSKTKAAAINEKGRKARQALASSIPFIAKSFDEHTEGSVEKAKAEIHGYMTGVIQRAGLEALGSSVAPPLAIENKTD